MRQTPTYAAEQIELQNVRPERVRYLRKQAVFSQESFADLCELDRTYIGGSDSPSGGQDDEESFRVSYHVPESNPFVRYVVPLQARLSFRFVHSRLRIILEQSGVKCGVNPKGSDSPVFGCIQVVFLQGIEKSGQLNTVRTFPLRSGCNAFARLKCCAGFLNPLLDRAGLTGEAILLTLPLDFASQMRSHFQRGVATW